MKIGIFIICILAFVACSNVKKKEDVKNLSSKNTEIQSTIDRKKIALIEAVVNLPDVLKYSKVKDARKKNIKFYLFEDELSKSSNSVITQYGDTLAILEFNKKNEISKVPTYHFEEVKIDNGNASVKMFFNNGLFAVGQLSYQNGNWKPNNDFRIGFR